MKKIKLFDDVRKDYIERQVNDFMDKLNRMGHAEIVDIRFNTYLNEHGHDIWTVMVIYEE